MKSCTGGAAAVLFALAVAGGPSPAAALPVISEVLYDAVGSDDGAVFVELYGSPGTVLDGWRVVGINGSDGATTVSLELSGAIPADGFFVLADRTGAGATSVANVDLLLDFDFQNGPDSIQLLDPGQVLIDALGYGAFGAGDVFAGEGNPAVDPPAGSSLARLFANLDLGDNALDFAPLDAPTPGVGPLSVPEPAAWASTLIGVCLAGASALRRPARPR